MFVGVVGGGGGAPHQTDIAPDAAAGFTAYCTAEEKRTNVALSPINNEIPPSTHFLWPPQRRWLLILAPSLLSSFLATGFPR